MVSKKRSPAHKTLIERYLDWVRVEERLARYKHIRDEYPIESLRACSNKPPYFCHYLAWRLGTWADEELFRFFDELLAVGASLSNWGSSKGLLRSCNFDDFWGLIWQLQVVEFFLRNGGTEVAWMKSGPDLRVSSMAGVSYVECYTYRKSFGIEEFIEELFRHIHPRIRVRHVPCIQFSLPMGAAATERFLDRLFEPYLDPAFLEAKLREAQAEYPVLLPKPDGVGNFDIYLEGEDVRKYVPSGLVSGTGPPELYLKHAIAEALDNKRESNRLQEHHPNLLMVNYLLDVDFQMAFSRQIDLGREIPLPDLGATFDGVLLAVCGIDEKLSMNGIYLSARQDHPILGVLGIGGSS